MRNVRHLTLLGKPVAVGDDVETVWQNVAAGFEFVAPEDVARLAPGLARPRYGRIMRMFHQHDTTWLQLQMFEPVVDAAGVVATHPWTGSPMLTLPLAPAVAAAVAGADPRTVFIPANAVHALVHVRHNCYMLPQAHGGRAGGGVHPCALEPAGVGAFKDAWRHHPGNSSWYLNQFVRWGPDLP